MRLYMPRFHVGSQAANLSAMEHDCREAAQLGSDIVMFPEMFLTGYYGEHDPGLFKSRFARLSAGCPGMLCIFGAISEDGFNRMYLYLDGAEKCHYDKVHLFHPNGEQEMWQVGQKYVCTSFGGINIGLATCNDVRFPEQARALVIDHGIKLMVYPALWPWKRDHVWAALLRARAIENGMFCAGCCIATLDNGREQFDGAGNHMFAPDGSELYPDGRVYEFDIAACDDVVVDTRSQFRSIETAELL